MFFANTQSALACPECKVVELSNYASDRLWSFRKYRSCKLKRAGQAHGCAPSSSLCRSIEVTVCSVVVLDCKCRHWHGGFDNTRDLPHVLRTQRYDPVVLSLIILVPSRTADGYAWPTEKGFMTGIRVGCTSVLELSRGVAHGTCRCVQ